MEQLEQPKVSCNLFLEPTHWTNPWKRQKKNPKICLEFVQAHNFQDPKILGGKPTKNTPIWFLIHGFPRKNHVFSLNTMIFPLKKTGFPMKNHDFPLEKPFFCPLEAPRRLSWSPTGQPTPSLPARWPRRSSPRASGNLLMAGTAMSEIVYILW